MPDQILLLEDDFFLRDGLTELLSREGYGVQSAQTCEEAARLLEHQEFDLLILDVMLPDGSGVELCKALRRQGRGEPILFLTACDEEFQIVQGLDAGGDDYVTKPFKMQELLSRVRALLRRRAMEPRQKRLDAASLCYDKNGAAVALTKTEYQILSTLLAGNGMTVTRAVLLDRIWDCDGDFVDDNTLSVHISRLREKIGPGHIVTVRGIGYRWEEKA